MFRHIVMLSFHHPLPPGDHDEIVRMCQTIQDELAGVLEPVSYTHLRAHET